MLLLHLGKSGGMQHNSDIAHNSKLTSVVRVLKATLTIRSSGIARWQNE